MNEQKWPNHLVIVRHGESERNVLKEAAKLSCQTESFSDGIRDMDTVLTEEGGRQALRTGKFLASRYEFDAAFSSPYRRAVETTDRILRAYEVRPPVIQEERLRELEFGVLDGLTWDAVKSRHPDEYNRRKREGKYWYRPPGGENRPDVALRGPQFPGDDHAGLPWKECARGQPQCGGADFPASAGTVAQFPSTSGTSSLFRDSVSPATSTAMALPISPATQVQTASGPWRSRPEKDGRCSGISYAHGSFP
jgi:broad specificity phosphatase PhoE